MISRNSLSIEAQSYGHIIKCICKSPDNNRYSNFKLKLNGDQHQLAVSETEYAMCDIVTISNGRILYNEMNGNKIDDDNERNDRLSCN